MDVASVALDGRDCGIATAEILWVMKALSTGSPQWQTRDCRITEDA
jgi:hypothetical protein